MGSPDDRKKFVANVRKSCELGKRLRELGVRKYGVIRIDSASSPADWAKDPAGNTRLIAQTWREACDVAKDYGERLAAEGEICWGGMHSWKAMVDTLEQTDRPGISFSMLRVVARSMTWLAAGPVICTFFSPDTSINPALVRIAMYSASGSPS